MPGIIGIRQQFPPWAVLQVRSGRQFAVKPSAEFVDSIVNEQHLDTAVVKRAASGHFNPAACRFILMYARLNRRAYY